MDRKKGLARRIALSAAALSVALSFSGCAGGPPSNEGGTVAVITQAQGIQFWELVEKGATEAGSEMGYTIDYHAATATSDIDGQKELVRTAIRNKVDGIVLAPNSATEMSDVLQEAQVANIPVITISSNANYPGINAYIGSDNQSAGQIAGRNALSLLEGTGKIAVVAHSATASNAQGRVSGFLSVVDAYNVSASTVDDDGNVVESAKFEVVENTSSTNGQRDNVKDLTVKLVQDHPDVDLIFATNEASTLGVCDALVSVGKAGQIKVVGFNSSDEEQAYIKNDTLTGTVVQSPYNMGYLGVRYIDAIKNGETLRSTYDTGAMFVTKSNINDDVIQLWLDPSQH